MRPKGSAAELERRRLLAVRRVQEGYSQAEVARFLEVNPRSVRRWMRSYRALDEGGLISFPHPGRPPKLWPSHESAIRDWLSQDPARFGFRNQLWTAPRLAALMKERWGWSLHPRYLNRWLKQRGFTPQKPVLQPRERDQDQIDRWVANDWPELKKKPSKTKPTWS
jgi:transposase